MELDIQFNDRLNQQAISAAKQIGPQVYEFDCKGSKKIRFIAMGCQGSGKTAQKEVADLIERLTQEAKESGDDEILFVLVLGDNIYPDGASSPDDPKFNTYFHDVYQDNKPRFVLLGNHDRKQTNATYWDIAETLKASLQGLWNFSWDKFYEKLDKKYYSSDIQGDAIAINQTAHSFRQNCKTEQDISDKRKLYEKTALTAAELPPYNMPYYYYSIVTGDTQIFCLDSNTYAKDYLNWINGVEESDKPNQAKWFQENAEKANEAGIEIIVAQHHPLFTCGKRAIKYDTHLYLSNKERDSLKAILDCTSNSYNELLALILKKQGIKPARVICAHDHFMSHYKNEDYIQSTLGGGGDEDLQEQMSVAQYQNIGAHIKDHGVAVFTYDANHPEHIETDYYTIHGDHLKFGDESIEPIYEKNKNPVVEQYRCDALQLCKDFLSDVAEQEKKQLQTSSQSATYQNLFTRAIKAYNDAKDWAYKNPNTKKIECVNKIMTYLRKPTLPDDLQKIVDDLTKIKKILPQGASDSFIANLFDKSILETTYKLRPRENIFGVV